MKPVFCDGVVFKLKPEKLFPIPFYCKLLPTTPHADEIFLVVADEHHR